MINLNKKSAKILIGMAGSALVLLGIALYSRHGKVSAPIAPVIARLPLDQTSVNQVMALDKQNKHATFVFVNQLPGRAMHNRVIMLPPVGDELRINFDQYLHTGHDGPLYIILPDNYAGPKEKFILKAFPDYRGWYGSMLSDAFAMYAAK